MFKRRLMIVPSRLEFGFTAADIFSIGAIACDGGFVNDRRASAFPVNRARIAHAVAWLVRFGVVGSLEKVLIMTCDYGMHIRKTTVTNFYRVPVKNFVIFVVVWKMLIN